MNAPFACPNGHPTEPDHDFCTTCGVAIEHDAAGSDAPKPPDTPLGGASAQPGSGRALPSDRGAGLRRRTVNIAVGSIIFAVVALVAMYVFVGGKASTPAASSHTGQSHSTVPVGSTAPTAPLASTPTAPATAPPVTSVPGAGPFSLLSGATVESGPAPAPSPFGSSPGPAAPAGTSVTIRCTAFGYSQTANGATSSIWDETSIGWIADVYVDTGTTTPTIGACGGTASDPVPTSVPLSAFEGPYPLLGDYATVSIYSDHSLQSPPATTVPAGTFVRLDCSVTTATIVQAPASIGAEGSNAQWDRITSPSGGWVPDSWVDSYSNGSVAPSCA